MIRSAARPPAPAPASGPSQHPPPLVAEPERPPRDHDGDATRKLIRPSLPAQRATAAAPVRREADGRPVEQVVLGRAAATGAVVSLRLETGEVLAGQVEWVDEDCLKLRRRDASPLLVMRRAIVSWHSDGAGLRRG